MIFEGSAAAVVTPMAENGAIDFEAMGKLLEFQLENGTDAIVVNGTTGESSTLQDEEKYKLIEFTVKRVHGRVPVIAGAEATIPLMQWNYRKRLRSLARMGF